MEGHEQSADDIIQAYCSDRFHEYRTLQELKQNPAAEAYFAKQGRRADATNNSTKEGKARAKFFYNQFQDIGRELHKATGAFTISWTRGLRTNILDMCMAPGGLLRVAIRRNPEAHITAFSLPPENGGHEVLLPPLKRQRQAIKLLDVTMLAADMGVETIPEDHTDFQNFLHKHLTAECLFDLVLCDGHVLRTHERAAYREEREFSRLKATQLALGLEHVKPGGTMVVLLHQLGYIYTAEIVHRFTKFSSVQLFKPLAGHAMRDSFYLIAKDIRADSADAVKATQDWKHFWEVATFGCAEDFEALVHRDVLRAQELIDEFGEELVERGKELWNVQAQALAKAPFLKNRNANRDGNHEAGASPEASPET